MYFGDMYQALTATLQTVVANGELSERRLARLAGISQPHIHNALRHKKVLSPAACDKILRSLGLTVFDLLKVPPDAPQPLCAECPHRKLTVDVPLLLGALGPGLPLPTSADPLQSHPFRSTFIATLQGAALVRLARDAAMAAVFRENDLALLDHSRHHRLHPDPRAFYVVNRGGEGVIRRIRLLTGRTLQLISSEGEPDQSSEVLPLGDHHMLDIVRARVVWLGRYLIGA